MLKTKSNLNLIPKKRKVKITLSVSIENENEYVIGYVLLFPYNAATVILAVGVRFILCGLWFVNEMLLRQRTIVNSLPMGTIEDSYILLHVFIILSRFFELSISTLISSALELRKSSYANSRYRVLVNW